MKTLTLGWLKSIPIQPSQPAVLNQKGFSLFYWKMCSESLWIPYSHHPPIGPPPANPMPLITSWKIISSNLSSMKRPTRRTWLRCIKTKKIAVNYLIIFWLTNNSFSGRHRRGRRGRILRKWHGKERKRGRNGGKNLILNKLLILLYISDKPHRNASFNILYIIPKK